MIQLIDITKKYYPDNAPTVNALNKVSLTLGDSGMVFILGKSGSGKSTLLNIIGGLDTYDEGDLIINGVTTKDFKGKDYDDYRNGYVGFVFQEFHLLENYTVGKNVSLPLELQSQGDKENLISKALEQVELKGYEKRNAHELSGGEKQRVAIARALVKEPQVILADEPSGNLDAETGEQIFTLLKKLSQNRLVVVVTHDRESARRYADRIIEISDGTIVKDNVLSDYKPTERADCAFKKSTLPFKNILSLGISNLKYRKMRLAFTTILFALTLACFLMGMSTLFFQWDKASLRAYQRIGEDTIILRQTPLNQTRIDFDSTIMLWKNKEKIEQLNNDFEFIPLYSRNQANWNNLKELKNYQPRFYYYNSYIKYAVLTEQNYEDYGINLVAGRLPTSTEEIALPIYLYHSFEVFGYSGTTIHGYNNMLGKTLYMPDLNRTFTIVGIVDTGLDEKYQELRNVDEQALIHSVNEKLNMLDGEFRAEVELFFHSTVFVSQQCIDTHINGIFDTYNKIKYEKKKWDYGFDDDGNLTYTLETTSLDFLGQSLDFAPRSNYEITRLIGEGALKDNEVIVPYSFAETYTINSNALEFSGDWFNLSPKPGIEDIKDKILSGMLVQMASTKNARDDFISYIDYNVVGYYIDSDPSVFKQKDYILMSDDVLIDVGRGDNRVISMVTKLTGDMKKDLSLLNFAFNDKVDEFVCFTLAGKNGESVIQANSASSFYKLFGLYSSLVLGIFSIVMMLNFIFISIFNKRKDIGILRAMGTRNRDIFLIFFCQAAIIALIAFICACVLGYVAMWAIGNTPFMKLLLVRIFEFDIKAVLSTFALAFMIAFVSCILPLITLLRKKPVEIIRKPQ